LSAASSKPRNKNIRQSASNGGDSGAVFLPKSPSRFVKGQATPRQEGRLTMGSAERHSVPPRASRWNPCLRQFTYASPTTLCSQSFHTNSRYRMCHLPPGRRPKSTEEDRGGALSNPLFRVEEVVCMASPLREDLKDIVGIISGLVSPPEKPLDTNGLDPSRSVASPVLARQRKRKN
jgi:hypothetical protein